MVWMHFSLRTIKSSGKRNVLGGINSAGLVVVLWFMLSWLRPIRGLLLESPLYKSSPVKLLSQRKVSDEACLSSARLLYHSPSASFTSLRSSSSSSNNNMTPSQPLTEKQEDTMPSSLARKVTPAQLVECGERLRAGDLVAFPTETVYGLGCHALDPDAVHKVFAAKERPLTDPLIVHVADTEDALKLWAQISNNSGDDDDDDSSSETKSYNIQILQTLCDAFWPGPLTLVAPAAPQVPSIIMANTGFVACRFPLHPLAQALIKEAKVPIAAPSANKFGHVSPTQANHVMDDLGQENVWVLEDYNDTVVPSDKTSNNNSNNIVGVACQVGVESTVAKLEVVPSTDGNSNHNSPQYSYALTVLRQGAISVQDLATCLENAGRTDVNVASLSSRTVEETEATVAPGQTVKHYSPRIPSFLLSRDLIAAVSAATTQSEKDKDEWIQLLQHSIVLDFGGRLAPWKSMAKEYRDMSPSADSSQAAQCVFEALRWAERINAEAKFIVFPQVVPPLDSSLSASFTEDALTLALHDRLTRAASGVVLDSVGSIREHVIMG